MAKTLIPKGMLSVFHIRCIMLILDNLKIEGSYMWFLIISVGLIFISEFWIKSRKPNIAKDDKKMRFIRAILLAITSPLLAIGLLSLRGDNIGENVWFIVLLTTAFTGIAIKKAVGLRNNA